MNKVTFFISMSLLLAACGQRQPVTSVRAEIEQASSGLWAAHENSDADSIAAMVTEDAFIMIPNAPDVRGKDQVKRASEQMFSTMRISDFVVQTREIDVCDNTAFEVATYTETLNFTDKPAQNVRGRYLIVWKRQSNGAWFVHRNLFNFAAPTQ